MGLANNFPQGNEREILTNSRYESSTLSTVRIPIETEKVSMNMTPMF